MSRIDAQNDRTDGRLVRREALKVLRERPGLRLGSDPLVIEQLERRRDLRSPQTLDLLKGIGTWAQELAGLTDA